MFFFFFFFKQETLHAMGKRFGTGALQVPAGGEGAATALCWGFYFQGFSRAIAWGLLGV